jgi:WD40-like Beta Propeller Repeat
VINSGPAGNQPGFDGGPNTSNDGLRLYFVSDRPGGAGGSDLWVARRTTVADPWSIPVNLGPSVNGKDMDASPSTRCVPYMYRCSWATSVEVFGVERVIAVVHDVHVPMRARQQVRSEPEAAQI